MLSGDRLFKPTSTSVPTIERTAAVLTGRGIAYVHYKHDETIAAMGAVMSEAWMGLVTTVAGACLSTRMQRTPLAAMLSVAQSGGLGGTSVLGFHTPPEVTAASLPRRRMR